MAINKLAWKIGGKAGYGIMVTGLIFSKACSRGGFHVFDTVEYPSLVRGGHNNYHVRVEDEEIHSNIELIDILVAFNNETIDKHKSNITVGGAIIFDSNETKFENNEIRGDIKLYDIPLLKIAKGITEEKIIMNTITLGATIAIIDYDLNILDGVITDVFRKKGAEVVNKNILAAKKGYDYVKKNYNHDFKTKLRQISNNKEKNKKRMLITGNEAISLGAIKAGCKFYSAYPMTPASSILHYMAANEKNMNLVVKQTEDEIAAIHAAIGASFAGVRSMTATSGGGFSLMVEGLGLAAMTETPLVIVNAQRPGPSTGLATRTEQGDLKFVLNASQGEFPHIIITPGVVDECFYLTREAFNLAEKFQVQVIIMTDKHLAESHKTTEMFNVEYKINRGMLIEGKQLKKRPDGFKRFEFTDTGVSNRTIPGQKNGIFRVPSYEHDEFGWMSEDPEVRIKMVEKRNKKMVNILKEISWPNIYNIENGKIIKKEIKEINSEIDKLKTDITIISWGSTKGAVLEAMKFLKIDGVYADFLHFNYINPLKTELLLKILKSAKKTIIVEQNMTLQFASIIKEKTGLDIDHSFSKYNGRQMYPHEIYDKIKEVLNN